MVSLSKVSLSCYYTCIKECVYNVESLCTCMCTGAWVTYCVTKLMFLCKINVSFAMMMNCLIINAFYSRVQ